MFKNLDKYTLSGSSITRMSFPALGAKAVLILSPALECNSPYYNAMLKMSGQRQRQLAKAKTVTASDIDMARDEDRVLYPRFVIKGWEKVEGDGEGLDENGYVPFTRENAQKLCHQLPLELFDDVRNEATTPNRFYADDEIPAPDADELAKN
jgi:hypothetical protein